MISLREYLKVDPEKHKFDLPLSFFGHIRYLIITKFLENLPFSDNLFIGEDKIKNYYWQIIINYLKKEFNADFYFFRMSFRDRFIQLSANFTHVGEDPLFKNIKGHGNTKDDWDIAVSKAVGELLERHTTFLLENREKTNFKKMSYLEIQKQAKTVRDFHGYSEDQMNLNPYLKINETDIFEVYSVEDLVNNKKVLYPISQILWNNQNREEKKLANITTSGCAGGFTVDEASVGAFYEAIERDSFFCYWLTKTVPQRILLDEGDVEEYDRFKKIFNEIGYESYILNTTTELGIPSVIFLVLDKEKKGICISGGADISLKNAIRKAVNEAFSCVPIFSNNLEYNLEENFAPFTQKDLFRMERLLLWKSGKYFQNISYILLGESVSYRELNHKEMFFESKESELNYLINILKEKGFTDIYRFVSQDQRLKLLNYSVVRIMVPKLYQLYLNEKEALTNSKRIDEFSVWKHGKKDWEINPWPHPFP